uniref:Uncharacterized protein n=1 Tax=Chryseobacterium endophyticum TaxID=1854762 RepID=A0AAU6WTC1_9FLAO
MDAVSDPVNANDVFFTNYMQDGTRGVYKMKYDPATKDFSLVKRYNMGTENDARRPVGLTFDDVNNLFVTLAFSNDGPTFGPFTAVGAYDRATDDFLIRNTAQNYGVAQKPLYYEGLLWIPTPRVNNFIAYDAKKRSIRRMTRNIY